MLKSETDSAEERWLTTLKTGDNFGERALLLDEVMLSLFVVLAIAHQLA